MSTTTTNSPVTLADVRAALGDTDPSTTNAGALRTIIGKGSFQTIQKHLETLRAELAPAVVQAGSAPAAPAEAVAAIWAAAWQSAQVQTLARLETVTRQRDTVAQELATTRADVVALAGEVDALTDDLTTARNNLDAATTALTVALDRATADAATAAAALVAVRSELSTVRAEAAHAAELATRDALLAAGAMQSTINRLTDQVGELKSLVHKKD